MNDWLVSSGSFLRQCSSYSLSTAVHGTQGACSIFQSGDTLTLAEPSGDITTNGLFTLSDDCEWQLTTPSYPDVLLRVRVTYLYAQDCNVAGAFIMPSGKQPCERIENTAKCFLYTKNPAPHTCSDDIAAFTGCENHATNNWPLEFRFNWISGGATDTGFNLEYEFIDCTDPTTTAATSAKTTPIGEKTTTQTSTITSLLQTTTKHTSTKTTSMKALTTSKTSPRQILTTTTTTKEPQMFNATLVVPSAFAALAVLGFLIILAMYCKRQNAAPSRQEAGNVNREIHMPPGQNPPEGIYEGDVVHRYEVIKETSNYEEPIPLSTEKGHYEEPIPFNEREEESPYLEPIVHQYEQMNI